MKTLTILGNGFDLGHLLPTTFDDFIATLPLKKREKYSIFRNGNNSWNDIESMYESLLVEIATERGLKDLTDELDRIRTDYGLNDFGEVNYYGYEYEGYDEELSNIADIVSVLRDFERDFLVYLRTYCSDSLLQTLLPKQPLLKIINQSNQIITFNYTHTAEILYGAKSIIHIHGDIDDVIVIGSGAMEKAKTSVVDYEYPQIDAFSKDKDGMIDRMAYYTEDLDGHLVEEQYTRRFFDEIATSAEEKENEFFDLLSTKSKESFAERQDTIDVLSSQHYDLVYVIGHSLGKADWRVFEAINKTAKIIYFYHNECECIDKSKILKELGFEAEMLSDKELFIQETI